MGDHWDMEPMSYHTRRYAVRFIPVSLRQPRHRQMIFEENVSVEDEYLTMMSLLTSRFYVDATGNRFIVELIRYEGYGPEDNYQETSRVIAASYTRNYTGVEYPLLP